jgi:hypothetical protein
MFSWDLGQTAQPTLYSDGPGQYSQQLDCKWFEGGTNVREVPSCVNTCCKELLVFHWVLVRPQAAWILEVSNAKYSFSSSEQVVGVSFANTLCLPLGGGGVGVAGFQYWATLFYIYQATTLLSRAFGSNVWHARLCTLFGSCESKAYICSL